MVGQSRFGLDVVRIARQLSPRPRTLLSPPACSPFASTQPFVDRRPCVARERGCQKSHALLFLCVHRRRPSRAGAARAARCVSPPPSGSPCPHTLPHQPPPSERGRPGSSRKGKSRFKLAGMCEIAVFLFASLLRLRAPSQWASTSNLEKKKKTARRSGRWLRRPGARLVVEVGAVAPVRQAVLRARQCGHSAGPGHCGHARPGHVQQ